MKRSPLRRRSRLQRSARLRPKRSKPRRRSDEPLDPDYLAFVRTLICLMHPYHDCVGETEAHHTGPRPGAGMKCPDRQAVPLCKQAHRDFHAAAGVFRGVDRRLWSQAAITVTQTLAAQAGVLKEED